tara:strand:+ start:106 stop:1044 length:939 start_codon:yes stop_codon:yes gene_type:complete
MVSKLLLLIYLSFCFSYSVRYDSGLYQDGKNARNAAIGGISLSYTDGSSFYNLNNLQHSSIHFSHKNKYGGLLHSSFLSYLYIKGEYPIYLGFINRSIEDIPDTRLAWIDNGNSIIDNGEIDYNNIRTIKQQEIGIQLSTIRRFGSYVIGFSIKPRFISLAEYKAFGVSGDLATSIQPEKNIDIIFSLKDIINISSWSSNSIETFAPIFMTGIHYKIPKLLIGVEVGSRVEKKTIIFYHLGLEYKNRDGVVMRLGTSYKNMITAGIGFKTSYFNIDYAYLNPLSNTPFPASHIFSISISLNRINKIKGIIKP